MKCMLFDSIFCTFVQRQTWVSLVPCRRWMATIRRLLRRRRQERMTRSEWLEDKTMNLFSLVILLIWSLFSPLYSFIHYKGLHSTSSRLLLGSTPDCCMGKNSSFGARVECVRVDPVLISYILSACSLNTIQFYSEFGILVHCSIMSNMMLYNLIWNKEYWIISRMNEWKLQCVLLHVCRALGTWNHMCLSFCVVEMYNGKIMRSNLIC